MMLYLSGLTGHISMVSSITQFDEQIHLPRFFSPPIVRQILLCTFHFILIRLAYSINQVRLFFFFI